MKRFMLLIAVMLFAISGMVQPTFAGNKDSGQGAPTLKGPKVERRDMSKEKPLKNVTVKQVKGERVKDEKGKEHCAYSVHLVREPGEAPKAARQVAFDPDACAWEVEFGEPDQQEVQQILENDTENQATLSPLSTGSNEQLTNSVAINALGSSYGEFVAVTLDPVGLVTNKVRSTASWTYDGYRVLGYSYNCPTWELQASGWWRDGLNCNGYPGSNNLKVVADATFLNFAFCNPLEITGAYYQGNTLQVYGGGGKEGWINRQWDYGDCASLLWQNSYLI